MDAPTKLPRSCTTGLIHAPGSGTANDEWHRVQLSLRQSEKRSRDRRVERISAMRDQVETLSRMLLALSLVDDADAVCDALLDDDDMKRMRYCARRLLPMAHEIKQLLDEKTLLSRLLREHSLVVRAFQTHFQAKDTLTTEWKGNVQRWRALARIHFRPWTIQQCGQEIEQATNEMNRRRIDENTSQFQFTLTKTFDGFDLDRYITASWRIYTEASVLSKVVFGCRGQLSFEVLQELSPTCCLIRFVESYDHLPIHVHRVYLLARIDTDDGAVQFMRSVRVPEVERVFNRPSDTWAFDFFWMRWEILDTSRPRSSSSFRASLGGTMFLEDLAYLHYWLFELLGATLRSEAWSTNRQLLAFD